MSEGTRPSAGFTLLELLLVLFVLSLAGAIVLPSLQPLIARTGIESTARKAASFLDDVRRRAVQTGRVMTVTLDGEEGRLVALPEGTGESPPGEEGGAEVAFSLAAPAEGTTLLPQEIRYFPQGTSSGGVLAFHRDGAEILRVTVSSFTGLATLEEARREGEGGPQ